MPRKVSIILPYYNRKRMLLTTLESFAYFYSGSNLEVVIVDDGSRDEERIGDVLRLFPHLDIRLIAIEDKTGINPCYPYNVGARHATGDIFVLSSPETVHTTNMFDICDFEKLSNRDYYAFSVFCVTDGEFDRKILSDASFADKLRIIEEYKPRFFENVGDNCPSFANCYGSWYLHSKYRPTARNFFTALTKEVFHSLSGFDERFRSGTGFDDDEFRDRILTVVDNVVYCDSAIAIHINHDPVHSGSPVTNEGLYRRTKITGYEANDDWGRL
tara:strand:+ start:6072 stop:6887 length:816 start_codon:yes stop_codon:yes gene_type:complete